MATTTTTEATEKGRDGAGYFAWRRNRQPGRPYTAGEVGALFGVAPRTVAKWLDTGRLKGYRLPGSLDRRFHADDVVRFGIEHGMFRAIGEVLVSDGHRLLTGIVHRRGEAVGLWCHAADGHLKDGLDVAPGACAGWEVKSGDDAAVAALVAAGFPLADGR